MADIIPSVPINIADELQNLSLYKYHPNGILNISLNRLQDILDGKVDILEPSNPFTYLIETTSLNTAFAILEYTLLTRKLYPRLANDEKDLYIHMSDFDYLGIFGEPAYATVTFNILFNDFTTKAYYDPVQKEHILKIPRHVKITIDDYVFTLSSAIIIRYTETEVIDVKFENQNFNNLFPVETNYLNFNIFRINQEETYLQFKVRLPEVDIEPVEIPVEKSKLFKDTLTYNPKRDFYYFRAFYLDSNSEWKEMIVTHTDEVYDIYNPTCIVKVYPERHELEYYIPPVYVNNNMLGTKVKFLIYTTKGYINVNFKDYNISQFNIEYNPIFPEKELDVYTEPLQIINKSIFIDEKVIGGKNSIDFISLKNAVIDNSIGDRKLPITGKQLEFDGKQKNFNIIKDVDVITNRVFLLELDIPKAETRYPISKINLEIIELVTTLNDLRDNCNNVVKINKDITIIPENTLFRLDDSKLTILTQQEADSVRSLSGTALLDEINRNKYVSTVYHYVLDSTSDSIDLRPYELTQPKIEFINFRQFNSTARVGINTVTANIYKTSQGFNIDVLGNLIKYVPTITEYNITPYLVFEDERGARFYLAGRLFTNLNNSPVYRFELNSNFYVDYKNRINITNFKDENNTTSSIMIDLKTKLYLIYVSEVVPERYQPSDMDSFLYNSYLAGENCVVTLEEFTIKFGDFLENLYRRVHVSTNIDLYETYTEDIPLRYKTNVYDSNNNIIHYANEVVLDDNGEPIIYRRKGEPVLDPKGDLVPIQRLDMLVYINFLLMDYKFVVANNPDVKNYVNFIKGYITSSIVNNAKEVQKELLENTVGYVVIPKSINITTIKTSYRKMNFSCYQPFELEVYVLEHVYNDPQLREKIEYIIVSELEKYLSENKILNKNEVLNILFIKLKEYVKSINFIKFTDVAESYIEILDKNARVSLKKLLVVNNNYYDIKEDVKINFIKISN